MYIYIYIILDPIIYPVYYKCMRYVYIYIYYLYTHTHYEYMFYTKYICTLYVLVNHCAVEPRLGHVFFFFPGPNGASRCSSGAGGSKDRRVGHPGPFLGCLEGGCGFLGPLKGEPKHDSG